MAILTSDINATISAALTERAAEILPISPKPPVRYGEIAKKLSLCVSFENNLPISRSCSLHRLRGRVGVGVPGDQFSSSGVMLFHRDSAVQSSSLLSVFFVVKAWAFVLQQQPAAAQEPSAKPCQFSGHEGAARRTPCAAVALRELPAAFTPIQRSQPVLPPVKIVNSADCSLTPACQFSGQMCKLCRICRIKLKYA